MRAEDVGASLGAALRMAEVRVSEMKVDREPDHLMIAAKLVDGGDWIACAIADEAIAACRDARDLVRLLASMISAAARSPLVFPADDLGKPVDE